MFDEALNRRMAGLETELNRSLYRRYAMQRDLARIEDDLTRIEAGLAEIERVRTDWVAAKAEEAQAKEAGVSITPVLAKKRRK